MHLESWKEDFPYTADDLEDIDISEIQKTEESKNKVRGQGGPRIMPNNSMASLDGLNNPFVFEGILLPRYDI